MNKDHLSLFPAGDLRSGQKESPVNMSRGFADQ